MILAAAIGLLLGVLATVIFFLVDALESESSDQANIRTLVQSNEERSKQGLEGENVALEILCKLKRYDLVTGLPALQARLDKASSEYNPQRAQTLEGALKLVLSIPSSASCVANPPNSPGVKAKGSKAKSLVQQVEQSLAGHEPAAAAPFTAPRASTPHGAPPRRSRLAPHSRGQPHKTTSTHPTTTTPAPSSSSPAPSTSSTPAPSSPAPSTPAPSEPVKPAEPGKPSEPSKPAEPSPPAKKQEPPLGICVEALHLVKVGCE